MAAEAKWSPVSPEELADAKPKIDPEAGAEILLRETVINHNGLSDMDSRHYVRAKIYSTRGIEDFAKIEIPYDNQNRISQIAARTIKPDGTILELNPKEIFDREVVKVGQNRYKVKSFAPPGIEPGAIVEYRYTEHSSEWTYFITMPFQSNLGARKVVYRYSPAGGFADHVYLRTLFLKFTKAPSAEQDKNGYYIYEQTNLPAAKEEPFSPPQISTHAFVLLYYTTEKGSAPELFWKNVGIDLYKTQQKTARPNKAIRVLVEQLITGSADETEKLRKLDAYCRTKIKNRDLGSSGFTAKQLAKLGDNENAADTLKAGSGTSYDINILFAAMASAAGLDARLTRCNRRDLILFDPHVTEFFMAPDTVVAVKLQNQWHYFDPGDTYLPFGFLNWRDSSTVRVMADATDSKPELGYSESDKDNLRIRTARLSLDSEGTLEGDVTLTYQGQPDAQIKDAIDLMTGDELETYFKKDVQEHLKLAELSQLQVENAKNPLVPLKVSYHLHVPEYADHSGTRLFFQPAVFQKNIPPLFSSSTRETDIIFHYPYQEKDEIHVTLPEGWSLEQATLPQDLKIEPLGSYDAKILYSGARNEIIYRRDFNLKAIHGGPKSYGFVRNAFEMLHDRDAHTLTLRKKAPVSDQRAAVSDPGASTPPAANNPLQK